MILSRIRNESLPRLFARGISVVMHPLLMPLYGALALFYGNTLWAVATPRLKTFFVMMVLLNALIVPGVCITALILLKYMGNFATASHRERVIPLTVVALCYVACLYILADISIAFLFNRFIMAALAGTLAALIFSYFWKISVYMIGAGGVFGLLLLLSVSGFGAVLTLLVLFTLLSGLLASARLYMGYHTPAQIGVGFLVGVVVSITTILLT